MRKKSAAFESLRSVDLFASCSDEELASVDSLLTEVTLEEGQELMREGAGGREFLIILEGSAAVSKDGEEVAEVGPGAFLGELALLDGTPRAATVRAITPVRAFVLNTGEFRSLLEEAPELRAKIEQAAAERRG